MGLMSFLLPADLPPDLVGELGRACVTGPPDNMPSPTNVRVAAGRLDVRRELDESGCLLVPWDVAGVGRVMGSTGTLVEPGPPYHLGVELARGKVNQVRSQAADWHAGGMVLTPEISEQLRCTSRAFALTVTQAAADQGPAAQSVLGHSYQAARHLTEQYVQQMFQARHSRQPRLDTAWGCRLADALLPPDQGRMFLDTFNSLALSFAWGDVEPNEGHYRWEGYDALLDWAQASDLPVTGGPLIDFSAARLPDWLWLWQRDLSSLASLMGDYVETVLKRYGGYIRTWQLTTASNCGNILGLGEDELLWLTAKLVEVARQIDVRLELAVGVAQPWGEYMAVEDRTHSPLIFADTLIRAGLNLAALDLEVVMGVSPRGSYCRDLLELSRLIDFYSLLGVPLRVTLGYPSAPGADPHANPELVVNGGFWQGGFSPQVQAAWAAACGALVGCKPSVRAVHWAHWSDAEPHQFPHCGLAYHDQAVKPALRELRALREKHFC